MFLVLSLSVTYSQTFVKATAIGSVNDTVHICQNQSLSLQSDLSKTTLVDFENGIPSIIDTISSSGTITNAPCATVTVPASNHVLWFSGQTTYLRTDSIVNLYKLEFNLIFGDTTNGCTFWPSGNLFLDFQPQLTPLYTFRDTISTIRTWYNYSFEFTQKNKQVWWGATTTLGSTILRNWGLDNIKFYTRFNADSTKWSCIEIPSWTSTLKNPPTFNPPTTPSVLHYIVNSFYNSIMYSDTLVVINESIGLPIITSILGNDTVCINATNQFIVNAINATSYTWIPSTIGLPVTTTSNTYNLYMAGFSKFVVKATNVCGFAKDSLKVYYKGKESIQICYIEYEPQTAKNKINWGYTGRPIDSIYIYREININDYRIVGKAKYSDMSFIDNDTINPNSQAYSYKINALNYCDSLGTISANHKTITLIKSYDQQNNSYGFSWSPYIGVTVPNYNIYGVEVNNNKTIIGTVLGNNYLYNYSNPNPLYVKYFVGFDITTCTGVKSTYSVKSNYVNSVSNGIFESKGTNFNIYPNPVTDDLIIESESLQITKFEIFNSVGQSILSGNFKTKSIVQTKNLSEGIYLIKLQDGSFKKFIKKS